MGYVWKGKPTAAPEPTEPPPPTTGLRPWNPDLCGTYPGYAQHKRHDIEICDDCREANNTYNRAIMRNEDGTLKLVRAPFDPSACGTYKGHRRHSRRGLEPCGPCRAAVNDYNNAYKAKRREQKVAA